MKYWVNRKGFRKKLKGEIKMGFLLLFVVPIGGIWLQLYLSRKESNALGLILPGLNFLLSLLMLFSTQLMFGMLDQMSGMGSMSGGEIIMVSEGAGILGGIMFALMNVPTVIMLIIYFVCRRTVKKNKEAQQMSLQDMR